MRGHDRAGASYIVTATDEKHDISAGFAPRGEVNRLKCGVVSSILKGRETACSMWIATAHPYSLLIGWAARYVLFCGVRPEKGASVYCVYGSDRIV